MRAELINPAVTAMRLDAAADPEAFWAKAAEALPWFTHWTTTFEGNPPEFSWYVGGRTNLAFNSVDRHVEAGEGGRAAVVYENERGERRVLTYAHLLSEVRRIAAALRGLGVERGDRVGIYMPGSPEAIALMLACARIGAIHIVVFAGFGSGALRERLDIAGARYLFTADATYRKGKEVELLPMVRGATAEPSTVARTVILQRANPRASLYEHELGWDDFLALGHGRDSRHVEMDSNDPCFILATSGTTAKPKLAVHTHGAYQVLVHSMGRWVFDLRPDDVWWSTSDIGWVVGHSYIVYGPLLAGCTTLVYEGALDHPGPDTFYRILEENQVTGVFTSPTAARLLMRYGSEISRSFDITRVRRAFCAGEVLNPPAWEWLQKDVFQDRIPVIDHMWQTETSGPIIGNPYGISLLPIKPGSSGIPLPGIEATVMTPEGKSCGPNEKGIMVITRPFPGLVASLWGDPDRYRRDYWERIPGKTVYFSGDAAELDEDGYIWFSGRADEIIKIAGHRIGTIEVETAFLRHPAVAEAGVTARPDPLRMEVIAAFVVLRQGYEASDSLRDDILGTVRQELGPIAVITDFNFVATLPKTRSGKIMRRVLKAVTLGIDPGDVSTIEDEGSVDEAREAWTSVQRSIR